MNSILLRFLITY